MHTSLHHTTQDNNQSRKQGSALLTAVICTIIVMFGIAALLPMMLTEWKNTSRTSAQEAAFSMAESGIEEACWAVLEYGSDDAAWESAGWEESDDGSFWQREWTLAAMSTEIGTNYELDEGRTGSFRVIAQKVDTTVVTIISQGTVTGGANVASDFSVSRYIEIQMRRPNPFAHGLIARDNINFNGRPFFDSYDSRKWPHDYSQDTNSGEEVTVGSISNDLSNLDLGNSTILGDLATGANDDGTDPSGSASLSGEVIWNFDMEFPTITRPSGYANWQAIP